MKGLVGHFLLEIDRYVKIDKVWEEGKNKMRYLQKVLGKKLWTFLFLFSYLEVESPLTFMIDK